MKLRLRLQVVFKLLYTAPPFPSFWGVCPGRGQQGSYPGKSNEVTSYLIDFQDYFFYGDKHVHNSSRS